MLRSLLFAAFLSLQSLAAPAFAQDTLAPASTRYAHPDLLAQVFVGGNYRATWGRPATLRIFRLDTSMGGFTVKKLGGGMQTKSLRIEDKAGEKYVLRTVDKTVDKAMEAEGIHSTIAQHVSQDMISAADPYAAVIVPPMARALGLANVDARLVFVADDAALGEYRPLFANTVCLLERQNPVLYEGDETENTKKLVERLKESPDKYRLDEKMLLQARLLDMLIGDWDRHSDQWKWEFHKEANGLTTILPVPHDHDQALFNSNGLLIKLVRPFALKHMVALNGRNLHLVRLNKKEWSFDKVLMGHLSAQDWRDGIAGFQGRLTNEVITEGVRQLPPEVLATRGDALIALLERRRDAMGEQVMAYYRYLQGFEAGSPLRRHGTDD